MDICILSWKQTPRFLGSSTHRRIEVEQIRPKQGDMHTLFLIGGAEFSKM